MKTLITLFFSLLSLPLFAQTYRVTTTADSGAGSLRAAIASVNASCASECAIELDLPAGSVIEPLTPLPEITACAQVKIGTAPVSRAGDRSIELSGTRQSTGHGLVFRASCPTTPGLAPQLMIVGAAINRFPWNGVHVAAGNLYCLGCFIGTDVTGRQARPNAGRGISVDDASSFVSVFESVLSGNGRSGVFAWNAREVHVDDSSVGTTPDGLPLPNGASGLFIRTGHLNVTDTTLGYINDFAIAVAGDATMLSFRNRITGTGAQAIDYGLNGPTLHGGNMPDVPELFSATYDAASGKTLITGRVAITRPGAFRHLIELQVDGAGSLQIGNQLPLRTALGIYDFTLEYIGDLRGKVVTVTNNRGYDEQQFTPVETSEMSNALVVR